MLSAMGIATKSTDIPEEDGRNIIYIVANLMDKILYYHLGKELCDLNCNCVC